MGWAGKMIICSRYKIISTTFGYDVSAFEGNVSLFMQSSSNTISKSRVNDSILDQN